MSHGHQTRESFHKSRVINIYKWLYVFGIIFFFGSSCMKRESERERWRDVKTCIQLEKLNFYAYFPFLLLAYCSFYREYARQWPNQLLNYDNAFGSIGRPLFLFRIPWRWIDEIIAKHQRAFGWMTMFIFAPFSPFKKLINYDKQGIRRKNTYCVHNSTVN